MGEACSKNVKQSDRTREFHLPWYALKVRTRSEPVAALALQNSGYDVFCPTYLERRRYSDRVKTIERPAFPGYLFCRFDAQRKVPVISTRGVEYVLSTAGVPSAIPEQEIKQIRQAVDAGARPATYLSVGQRVRVEYGSLSGIEGILVKEVPRDRLVVSIELLQRAVAFHIDQDQVRAI